MYNICGVIKMEKEEIIKIKKEDMAKDGVKKQSKGFVIIDDDFSLAKKGAGDGKGTTKQNN